MPNPKKEVKRLVRMVVPLTLKASVDTTARTFEGFAATWDQDLGQDVIKRGAFKATIAAWKKSGEALPLLDSHDQFSIMSALGQLVDAQETSKGLWTKWEVIDGAEGDAVLARLRPSKTTKRAIVGKMSIGFFPQEFGFTQPDGTKDPWDRIRNITKADLKEVSLVLFPMNPNASIDAASVKSFMLSAENTDGKELNVLTKKELRRLAGVIGGLLAKQDDEADDDLSKKRKANATTPPAPAIKTDLEEVEEDEEDDEEDDDLEDPDPVEIDEEDDIDLEDEDEEEDTDDDTDEDESEEDDTGEEGKSANDNAALPIYQFTDALAQRIAKLNLTQRVEELTNNS